MSAPTKQTHTPVTVNLNEIPDDLRATVARIERERDDLLAACEAGEGAISSFVDGNLSPNLAACSAIVDMLRAAITEAYGEN